MQVIPFTIVIVCLYCMIEKDKLSFAPTYARLLAGVAKSQKCILVHGQLVVKKHLSGQIKALLARTQINTKTRFVNIMI